MSENNQIPNGQQPPFNPQQPNNQQPQYNAQQPYGQQPPYNAQQPNNQQPPYNAQQPNNQQPPYNAQQSYGQQPPYNAQQPYGQQPPFNPQQPYSQQAPYNAQQPYGQQPPYNQQPYYARPVADNTKLFSILSYLGFLWIIGLLADRNNPRVRYHVNQGIILFIFECIFRVISWVLGGIFNFSFWYSGDWFHFFPLGIVNSALGLITVILTIIGIVHAAQDREEPLPIIGNLFTIVK